MKIATVVPRTHFDEGSEAINLENFKSYVEQASRLGADLVVFLSPIRIIGDHHLIKDYWMN